eukprot:6282220-Amphidinium_carterae.1
MLWCAILGLSWAHKDEGLGGYQAASRFDDHLGSIPLGSCIFLNHEPWNSALYQRRNGYKAICEEQNLEWLPEVPKLFERQTTTNCFK